MRIKYYPYLIILKEKFTISLNSRSTTPAVMVEIDHDGITGYGEASLPPYLQEDQKSVINFLKRVDLTSFENLSNLNLILDYIDNLSDRDNAAKAAVDIALYDLFGKIKNISLNKFLNIKMKKDIYTSYTIGITDIEKLGQKISDVCDYKYLKIKLGTNDDKELISIIRKITDKPLFVDINQGWRDKHSALETITWLAGQKVVLVEQPLPKENIEDIKWLKERSPLPVIADEAIQSFDDIEVFTKSYSGINIKLMKSGGIRQAYRMITKARELDLKIMLGCMTETSCAITAASHLASLVDWVDLDGAELISNDLFTGTKIKEGKLVIPDSPGIGVLKL